MSNTTETADWSQIFDALADAYRRETLRYLTQVHQPARLITVADHLVSDGHEVDTDAERDRVLVSLYHHHLPKLTDAGLVDWDGDTDTLELTPLAFELPVGLVSPQPLHQSSSGGVESVSD